MAEVLVEEILIEQKPQAKIPFPLFTARPGRPDTVDKRKDPDFRQRIIAAGHLFADIEPELPVKEVLPDRLAVSRDDGDGLFDKVAQYETRIVVEERGLPRRRLHDAGKRFGVQPPGFRRFLGRLGQEIPQEHDQAVFRHRAMAVGGPQGQRGDGGVGPFHEIVKRDRAGGMGILGHLRNGLPVEGVFQHHQQLAVDRQDAWGKDALRLVNVPRDELGEERVEVLDKDEEEVGVSPAPTRQPRAMPWDLGRTQRHVRRLPEVPDQRRMRGKRQRSHRRGEVQRKLLRCRSSFQAPVDTRLREHPPEDVGGSVPQSHQHIGHAGAEEEGVGTGFPAERHKARGCVPHRHFFHHKCHLGEEILDEDVPDIVMDRLHQEIGSSRIQRGIRPRYRGRLRLDGIRRLGGFERDPPFRSHHDAGHRFQVDGPVGCRDQLVIPAIEHLE